MRIARAHSTCNKADPAIAALAGVGELDLLQLDYDWPGPAEYCEVFLKQLRTLHKQFFLEPSLRLITNAGGGNVVACVEALGGYLREHGDADMPITAVRGDNLLPKLSELASDGIELIDRDSGESVATLKEPLLAAQVELGAGPLATAWDEGSRMIVAGCYDPTAPFVGAARSTYQRDWDDYDALARVALAARVAELIPSIADILAPDQIFLEPVSQATLEPENLIQRLREDADEREMLEQADVVSDISSLTLRPSEFGSLSVAGVRGQKPTGSWLVRLTYSAHNVVESSQTIQRWTSVPRDAVNISVDTRPASEWF